MVRAWRIVKEVHAGTAFSGEGAVRVGGRWNSRGTLMVYTSATQSLALLESLVHLNPTFLFRYAVIGLEFPGSALEILRHDKLPPDWTSEPPATASKRLGDQWVREGRSAVLAVPSVLVRSEINYLINPAHPDFAKIKISKPEPFSLDPRLLKS
jgi:RES domain-containing protein